MNEGEDSALRQKSQVGATAAACLAFAVVGFLSQGMIGAFNFGWSAFILSVLLCICLEEFNGVISAIIVCGIIAAIGLVISGMAGAFYGAGLALSMTMVFFIALSMLEASYARLRNRKYRRHFRLEFPSKAARSIIEEPPRPVTPTRPPNSSEQEAISDRILAQGLKELLAERRMSEGRNQKRFPTVAALVMARAAKRVARKYGELGLARAAKDLEKRAMSSLKMRLSFLINESRQHSWSPEASTGDRGPTGDAAASDGGSQPHSATRYLTELEQDERDTEKMVKTLRDLANRQG
jgi:hypothetical protein